MSLREPAASEVSEGRLRKTHRFCAFAHLLLLVVTVFVTEQYPDTKQVKRVTGSLELWLSFYEADSCAVREGMADVRSMRSFRRKVERDSAFRDLFVCNVHTDDTVCDADYLPGNCPGGKAKLRRLVQTVASDEHSMHIPWLVGDTGLGLTGIAGLFKLYFVCSFVQHAGCVRWFDRYWSNVTGERGYDLRRASWFLFVPFGWPLRWAEYALSASLMSLIVTTADASTPTSVWQTVAIVFCTMACGYAIEVVESVRALASPATEDTRRADAVCWWLEVALFATAGFAQVVGLWATPWIRRFSDSLSELEAGNTALFGAGLCQAGPPPFVGPAVYSTALNYCSFAFVMAARIRSTRPSKNDAGGQAVYRSAAIAAELRYAMLSLFSKLTLAGVFLYALVMMDICDRETVPACALSGAERWGG
jgi:hypothetical protein